MVDELVDARDDKRVCLWEQREGLSWVALKAGASVDELVDELAALMDDQLVGG